MNGRSFVTLRIDKKCGNILVNFILDDVAQLGPLYAVKACQTTRSKLPRDALALYQIGGRYTFEGIVVF